MKRVRKNTGLPALLVVSACILLTGGPSWAQEVTLRMGGVFPATHSSSVYMETFRSEVARLTNGDVRVDLFPGSQLGGSSEQVDQIATGQYALAWGGPNDWASLVPQLQASELPFAASSDLEAFCIIDGELGKYLEQKVAEKGVTVLGWASSGLRYISNSSRPITNLADMEGLRIRVPAAEAWLTTFRALGANPTPLDITEVYQALQQGVVDGQENPPENILSNNFQEVQRYLTKSGHFFSWVLVVGNKTILDDLKPEYQEAIRTAANTAIAAQRAASTATNLEAQAKMIAAGMEYNELSNEAVAEFREAASSVYEAVRTRAGDEAVDLALEAIDACSR